MDRPKKKKKKKLANNRPVPSKKKKNSAQGVGFFVCVCVSPIDARLTSFVEYSEYIEKSLRS